MIYGDGNQYIAYSTLNVGHTVPVREGDVLNWFGITGTQFPGGGTTPTTTTLVTSTTSPATTSIAPTTTTTPGGTLPKWSQW